MYILRMYVDISTYVIVSNPDFLYGRPAVPGPLAMRQFQLEIGVVDILGATRDHMHPQHLTD